VTGGTPTWAALVRAAAARLARVAGPAARLEAEVLAASAAGRSRAWLVAHGDEPATAPARRKLRGWLRRRITGREPVAYLTGRREFAGLDLEVTRGVLVPRPETEGLVERVEAWLRARPARPGEAVADAGTGSGAIAVALAVRLGVRVIATDRSAIACRIAWRNARRHDVTGLVRVRRGRWLGPARRERLAAVVSNPPYLTPSEMRRLQPEVRREPPSALAGGGLDGLDAIRSLVARAGAVLPAGGLLALEIGAGQGPGTRRLLANGPWRKVRIERDLAGRTRYALAERAPEYR
jgi:release factor glutamine methyltransferase